MVTVVGYKKIKFKDGHIITYDNPNDTFYNTVIGNIYHQVQGKITFTDQANNIKAYYDLGYSRKKTQEYFKGKIEKNGK